MKKRKIKAGFIWILLFLCVLVGCSIMLVKEFQIWKAEKIKEEKRIMYMKEWTHELLEEIAEGIAEEIAQIFLMGFVVEDSTLVKYNEEWISNLPFIKDEYTAHERLEIQKELKEKILLIGFVAENSVLVKYNGEWLKISKLPFVKDEYTACERLGIQEDIKQPDKIWEETEEKTEEEEIRYEDIHATRPEIPLKGKQLSDFIPENWELFDQASLDFNQDGVEDFVGIMKHIPNYDLYTYDSESPFFPYILFAVASEGDGYRLDFQDVNLITTWSEAAMSGVIYYPITADGVSFTTDIEGGTAATQIWKEKFTYTYKDGTWYLTMAERIYSKIKMSSYQFDNYETGIGIRKEYCGTVGEAEEALQEKFEKGQYEEIDGSWYLVYSIELDEAPTLSQAGMREKRSLWRVWEYPVKSTVIKEGIDIELDENELPLPSETGITSCNEEGICYCVRENLKGGERKYYLFYYQWRNLCLSVLAESDVPIMETVLYKEKIYYFVPVILPVYYYNEEGEIRQGDDRTGLKLYQINTDGTDAKILFEYHLPRAGRDVLEDFVTYYSSTNSYISFIIQDVTEKELIVSVFGVTWMPIYRIDLDSEEIDLIGYYRLEGWG